MRPNLKNSSTGLAVGRKLPAYFTRLIYKPIKFYSNLISSWTVLLVVNILPYSQITYSATEKSVRTSFRAQPFAAV